MVAEPAGGALAQASPDRAGACRAGLADRHRHRRAVRSGGTLGSRIKDKATSPAGLRRAMAVARLLQPNLVLKAKIITAYENNGTAFVTRRKDVTDVLTRDEDFGVVYGPRMETITGGENFFLGMQDTPRYTRDTSNMRLAMRREDVPAIITPFVAATAAELVAAAPGKIDVPQQLSLPTAARLLDHYFGTPGPLGGGDRRLDEHALLVPVPRPQGRRGKGRRGRRQGEGVPRLARRPYRRAQGERRAARRRPRPLPRHAGAAGSRG